MREQQIKQLLINYNMGVITATEALNQIAEVLLGLDLPIEGNKAESNEELVLKLSELFKI